MRWVTPPVFMVFNRFLIDLQTNGVVVVVGDIYVGSHLRFFMVFNMILMVVDCF